MIRTKKQIPEKYANILNLSEQVLLESYDDPQWIQVFQSIDQSFHTCMSFYNYGKQAILNSISRVSFENLTALYLQRNRIANIQSISFLHAPNLELLEMSQNHIVNFQPLEKAKFRKLETLSVYNNKSTNFSFVKRVRWNQQFQGLILEDFPLKFSGSFPQQDEKKKFDAQTITTAFLAKVNFNSIGNLLLESDVPENRKRIGRMLLRYHQKIIQKNQENYQAM